MQAVLNRWWLTLALFAAGCDGLAPPGRQVGPMDSAGSNDGLVSVYFSQVWDKPAENKLNPDNIAGHCARTIASARRTLDICCHEIDNRVIIEAVVAAHARGVKVRVVTETDYEKDLGPETFKHVEIPVISDHRKALMHNKFMVIDGALVWTGSFNFTENCAYKNNNNGIVIRDKVLAENYTTWFDWFWEYGKSGHHAGPPSSKHTPHPIVELADGTRIENHFTTFDKLDAAAVDVIHRAKKSIKFLAFSYTHKGIAKAMLDRAAAGVKVVGVFESRNLGSSEYHAMSDKTNVQVYPDGNPFNMHHKVIVVDDAIVLTGSFNFSSNAANENDENIVIVQNNPGVVAKYREEFDRVLRQATTARATASHEGSGATHHTHR
jgi:phosphatidylserine/phosphatidylglycerophosphate/cardiolipin synthase-like enzyme